MEDLIRVTIADHMKFQLGHLRPVLNAWVEAVLRYCKLQGFEDAPCRKSPTVVGTSTPPFPTAKRLPTSPCRDLIHLVLLTGRVYVFVRF
jgi:hypothetical protein